MTQGVLCERLDAHENTLIKIPDYLTDAEASTLPCAAVTAWSALTDFSLEKLKPGSSILLQGTGGVSLFCLQFAKALQLKVIITSSSDAKLERAKELGADAGINYRTNKKWGREAHKLSNGGVDLVVDVGGAGTLSHALDAVRVGGRIMMVGNLAGRSGEIKRLDRIFYKAVRIYGVVVGHRRGFQEMLQVMNRAKIRPIVDKVFGFKDAKKAFDYMAEGKGRFGKIVVNVGASKTIHSRL
mmetsp:Transcript_8263/g.15584  ORF Transcript_8263/g.15584 Transcript_8263/m.15584 type:complete len:241 (-) Transcript_8263:146-868(-)